MVQDAPGTVNVSDGETLNSLLGFPADSAGLIDDGASMMHMMNANTFTAGAYHVADAADMSAVVDAIKDKVMNNHWMCGFPEPLLIRNFSDAYVLVAFGVNDAMTPFEKHLSEVYPGMETITNEPIL